MSWSIARVRAEPLCSWAKFWRKRAISTRERSTSTELWKLLRKRRILIFAKPPKSTTVWPTRRLSGTITSTTSLRTLMGRIRTWTGKKTKRRWLRGMRNRKTDSEQNPAPFLNLTPKRCINLNLTRKKYNCQRILKHPQTNKHYFLVKSKTYPKKLNILSI